MTSFLDNNKFKAVLGIIACGAVAFFVFTFYSIAPSDFPETEMVEIEQGTTLSQAAKELKENGIIKSTTLFRTFVVLTTADSRIKAGNYLFNEPQSVVRVASRLIHGIRGIPEIKVTLYEGMTARDMGDMLAKQLPDFNKKKFVSKAKEFEGYLFPDTYYFTEESTPEQILAVLRETFDRKIITIKEKIDAFGKPMADVMKMASIVEKEATSTKDRRIVAGILWKRLENGMPLQVDAPFYYTLGKTSDEITRSDLAGDSPYNLYKNTGLTPAPISNPGLEAILDTVNPTDTDYLFFLTGKDGKMHYASTFDGHSENIGRYLE